MKYEKIIKREDVSQLLLTVYVYILGDYMKDTVRYDFSVVGKAKGKRNWNYITPMNDHVTDEEVFEAKLALWNLLKPIADG